MSKDALVEAHLRVSRELTKKAAEQVAAAKAQSEKVRALAKAAVDALVANDKIYAEQAAEVTEKLAGDGGAVRALELLRDLASHRSSTDVPSMGKAAGASTAEKKASYRVLGQPVYDYDATEEGREFYDRLMNA